MDNPEKKQEYISLEEASKYCNYKQDYLSLRARQKKLKAVKLGRNWVTTKEWLEEYVGKVEEYKNGNGKVEPASAESLPAEKDSATKESLPAEKYAEPSFERKAFPTLFSSSGFLFALSLMVILIFSFLNFSALEKTANEVFDNTGVQHSVEVTDSEAYLATAGYTIRSFKEYKEWLVEKISDFGVRAKNYAKGFFEKTKQFFVRDAAEKEVALEEPLEAEDGAVVWPSSVSNEQTRKKIERNFSDKVKIETKDESTGIIIPVFREREGDEYMYMLVPVEEDKK